MVHELGVDIYRFSIAWPRLLPTGFSNYINPLGLAYYKNLLDELERYNITPMVTIYHWDLPQKLQDIGGWSNVHIVDWFTDYAKVLFDNFADKVKYWVTFNEPMQTCLEGYGGTYRAPALNRHGIAEYLCTHNLLKAHASVYHLFNKQYKPLFGGKYYLYHYLRPQHKKSKCQNLDRLTFFPVLYCIAYLSRRLLVIWSEIVILTYIFISWLFTGRLLIPPLLTPKCLSLLST